MNNFSQKKLEEFIHSSVMRRLSPSLRHYYEDLERDLLESEEKPQEEIVQLAKRIKPLVRLQKSLLKGWCINYDKPTDDDILVFMQSMCIDTSFLFNFHGVEQAVHHNRKVLKAEGLQKVGEFSCYHRIKYGMFQWFQPCVIEVLQQLPKEYENAGIDAFEIRVESTNITHIYDPYMDCHVSTVVLYALDKGLPSQVRHQPVRIDHVEY